MRFGVLDRRFAGISIVPWDSLPDRAFLLTPALSEGERLSFAVKAHDGRGSYR
jgi:hypothetical protein